MFDLISSEDVFSNYVCYSLNQKNIQCHPGDIVEAGCLAVSYKKYIIFSAVKRSQRLAKITGILVWPG